jgi:hypothetical protein
MAKQRLLKEEAEELQNLPIEHASEIQISKPTVDKEDPADPNYQKTKDWLKQVTKDAYVNEAWHILSDITR